MQNRTQSTDRKKLLICPTTRTLHNTIVVDTWIYIFIKTHITLNTSHKPLFIQIKNNQEFGGLSE